MSVIQLTIPTVKIKELDMQRAFYRAFCQRYEMVANNLYLGWCGGEMDLFGLRGSGFVDEIEIKRSVSDFRADFKKSIITRKDHEGFYPKGMQGRPVSILKHEALKDGLHACNYFSFLVPIDIADKCEIPEHAGLYVFDQDAVHQITEVKKAPRLHTRRISEHNKYKTARKMHYRYWESVMAAGTI